MQPKEDLETNEPVEAVVGIFEHHQDASRVAASLRGPEFEVRRVSRRTEAMDSELPELIYDEIEEIDSGNATDGMIKGGAIGVGSGLLLMGIPGLNVFAPIAAGLAGAWIGGVAAIDESKRGIELPNREDYQRMLAEGKSFVVLVGDEATRGKYESQMKSLGAIETHQHPPIGQSIRTKTILGGDENA